ncbi:UNVERIFIED_ORG: DNA-binding transcriptional LysR family regulator [Rhizobium etli]
MESNTLARRELDSGRLVRPFSNSRDNRYIGHYLAYPKAGSQRRLSKIFADWLMSQVS